MSWEELFKHMDSDGGGSVDLREFRAAVRSVLRVAESGKSAGGRPRAAAGAKGRVLLARCR